jgi:hypothetical protein
VSDKPTSKCNAGWRRSIKRFKQFLTGQEHENLQDDSHGSPSMLETYIGGLRLKERQLQNMKTVFSAADLICATYGVILSPLFSNLERDRSSCHFVTEILKVELGS